MTAEPRKASRQPLAAADAQASATAVKPKKLSYKENRELEELPGRIEAFEREQDTLQAMVAGPEFYKEPATTIDRTLARLSELEGVLVAAYERWDELDSRK
ncbi:MAG: hypothetical protein LBQ09_03370 [Acidobacteriaceae bacterium]|nr:hypothetical protein [Acidobacteriaceae bacterium]